MASLKNLTANADPHIHVGGIQSYRVVCASCGRVSIKSEEHPNRTAEPAVGESPPNDIRRPPQFA